MKKKLVTPCRVILLIGAVCVLAILSNGKVNASVPGAVPGGVYEKFFDFPPGAGLVHIDSSSELDTVVELTDEVTISGMSQYDVVLSDVTIVSDRYSVWLMPNSFVTLDLYQSHPDTPDILEPLAEGVMAMISEDRWLKNGVNGQMIMVWFADPVNQNIPEENKTVKGGYNLVVKFNPAFDPGFYCLRSIEHRHPISFVRGIEK